MAERRSSDAPGAKSRYRSNRMTRHEGRWYFETREGTVEGPYDSELEAIMGLSDYVKVMKSGVLGESSGLALQPLSTGTTDYRVR